MLAPILQNEVSPFIPVPPVVIPSFGAARGDWLAYKVGAHWVFETPAGIAKAENVDHYIQAARRLGIKIKWLE